MTNSDCLITGNDEHGLEPMPTESSGLLPPEKVPIYRDFAILLINIIVICYLHLLNI